MQLSISPDFWVFNFLKNAEERDLKIADYLDQTADEATNLARVWENVAEIILGTNRAADVDDNINWSRLIERPEWTIYSKNIPKSRLEMFFESVSKVMGKGQRGSMDYLICKMGSILQKRKLTKEIIEEEFKLIKTPKFFDKRNRMHEDISLSESISLMNSEAEAITAFSREFRSNLLKAMVKPIKEVAKPAETIKPAKKRMYLFPNLSKILFLKKITDEHLLKDFRAKYISVSGLNVSEDFLKERTVYAAFNLKNRMCGGFVLGNTNPYRTIEVFAGEESKKKLYDFVEGTSYCELNCFWLSVKSRKGFWGYWFWLLFAVKVSMQKEKMLMYGTIAKSLANIYGYPKKSKLLHKEELMFDGTMRTSWIFIGARTDFFVGVLETFIYKFRNNNKKPVKYKRVTLSPPNAASAKAAS
ncbi:MAG TPA: hypothetical protein VIZ28_08130 [Chitinophagaceae bacterium]